VNECRVSVRDVRGSAPRRRSDASLTHCPVEVDSEMCPEMRLAGRDVPRKNIHKSNLANARTSELSEIRPTCPKFAPRARNSRRGAEIRVAKTPSDDEPSHFFFFSLPLKIPSFFGTLIEIYIYIIFYFLTPPRYFGQRNTRLGYFLRHFRCSSVRQIRFVYILKNIHNSNLANARTSELSDKVLESSITQAEISGGVKN